ncbi:Hypothetical predicted protein [Olea europaea subsp. europaea]|uniref:DUF4378 domain-containing protein n=1 Tax=Olea europaea subsp. europaea TaxID=158383 RepID=A0A8S0S0E3_OLEEU|nr:Hypothetical predicted protein [Olea europaea subsp. europaea]
MRSSFRSKSLPPPSGSCSIHKRSAHCDAIAEGEYLMHRNAVSHSTSKTVKGNLYLKEDFTLNDLKSRNKKPLSCHHAFTGETDSSLEAGFEIQMDTNLEKDPSEQKPMSQMAKADGNCNVCTSPELSSKSSELSLKQSSSELENVNAIAHNEGVPSCQEPHKGPPHQGSDTGSSENSLQADPSPDSVLEVPLTEDVSSVSECFESVNAELHELQIQLQLLKMESQACVDAPTLNDVAQKSHMMFVENYMLGADDWKDSYVLDVLINSGFEESHLFMFRTLWYCSECPLSPWLFDDVEKKYNNDGITGLREERRFLFDRINSALFEAYQQHVDLYPWVMPKIKCVNLTCQKQVVRGACQKLLKGHDFETDRYVPERILDREMQWLEFKGEIDAIGNEIEKLLIDKLITEFLFSF